MSSHASEAFFIVNHVMDDPGHPKSSSRAFGKCLMPLSLVLMNAKILFPPNVKILPGCCFQQLFFFIDKFGFSPIRGVMVKVATVTQLHWNFPWRRQQKEMCAEDPGESRRANSSRDKLSLLMWLPLYLTSLITCPQHKFICMFGEEKKNPLNSQTADVTTPPIQRCIFF